MAVSGIFTAVSSDAVNALTIKQFVTSGHFSVNGKSLEERQRLPGQVLQMPKAVTEYLIVGSMAGHTFHSYM